MNESEFNTFLSLCLLHNDYNFESGSIESQLDSANILQLSKSAFIIRWHWNSILFENIRSQEVSRSRTSPLLMRNKKINEKFEICFRNAEIFPPSVDQIFYCRNLGGVYEYSWWTNPFPLRGSGPDTEWQKWHGNIFMWIKTNQQKENWTLQQRDETSVKLQDKSGRSSKNWGQWRCWLLSVQVNLHNFNSPHKVLV